MAGKNLKGVLTQKKKYQNLLLRVHSELEKDNHACSDPVQSLAMDTRLHEKGRLFYVGIDE